MRRDMPQEARWESAIETAKQMALLVNIMERYAKPVGAGFKRHEVDLCCANEIPGMIAELTTEEAGLKANFPDKGNGNQPGSAGAKVPHTTASVSGPEGA